MDSDSYIAQLKFMRIPLNDSIRVWRYMGMNRLEQMLDSGKAYFRRLDCLEDQFEAVLSPIGIDRWTEEFAPEAIRRRLIPEGVDPYETGFHVAGSATNLMRASVYVNCWQRNEYESWAMWNSFGTRHGKRAGVAIQSTVGRLRDGLMVKVSIGEVKYIDHETDETDWRLSWLYKNHMYSWEQEIRAYTFHTPSRWSIAEFNRDHPDYLFMPAALDTLIERVVLAPGSDGTMRNEVQELLAGHGLGHKAVSHSAADLTPEYVKYSEMNRQAVIEKGLIESIQSDGVSLDED